MPAQPVQLPTGELATSALVLGRGCSYYPAMDTLQRLNLEISILQAHDADLCVVENVWFEAVAATDTD